ncbi:CHAP domain-containing protein [Lactococcus petauri]|uniref:CHAP domain-containing protein n=1 Tax=Lactococcus petauri TaxID=1940789 RepID=UPI0038547B05
MLSTSALDFDSVKAGSISYIPKLNVPVVDSVENFDDEVFSVENIDTHSYSSSIYGYKQCTWWAYNRARDFGISYGEYMGNGAEWKFQPGYSVSSTPVLHSVISFGPGQTLNNGLWQADATYGHVAFVEAVYADGSLLISESGTNLETEYTIQIISPSDALQLDYVIGQ